MALTLQDRKRRLQDAWLTQADHKLFVVQDGQTVRIIPQVETFDPIAYCKKDALVATASFGNSAKLRWITREGKVETAFIQTPQYKNLESFYFYNSMSLAHDGRFVAMLVAGEPAEGGPAQLLLITVERGSGKTRILKTWQNHPFEVGELPAEQNWQLAVSESGTIGVALWGKFEVIRT